MLRIDPSQDILDTIAARPVARAAADRAFIATYEGELARGAKVQSDARFLLESLLARGCVLGLVTRNSLEGADLTLRATGLDPFFAPAHRVGRDCAAPKPDPAGVRLLLSRWGVSASCAVMVGDWIHDIRAGQAAGTATVLVRRHGPRPWDDQADVVVDQLAMLA